MAQTKKITNFNEMRDVIITAHKAGNRKAISKDMVSGANVDVRYFNAWQSDVNALRATVANYVLKKRALKYGYQIANKDVTADDVFAAKELIFPKWKEVLQVGEIDKNDKELHVDVDDVEDLIGFVWDFMDSGKGTVETIVTEQIFRKKVESLLGCAIAKNAVLEDGDRDTLTSFRSAERRVQKCIDAKADLEATLKTHKDMLANLKNEEVAFKAYLENLITADEKAIADNDEAKANAEADVAKYSADAKVVLNKIRFAK